MQVKQRSELYLGRPSLILADEEMRAALRFLPAKYEFFKAFVQYQATVDGRYLQNLWNSYEIQQKESFAGLSATTGIQEGQNVRTNFEVDFQRYNLNIHREKLVLTKI